MKFRPIVNSSSSSSSFLVFSLLLLLIFPTSHSVWKHKLHVLPLVHFEAMSCVVKNNNYLLQLLATPPAHQRQFLLQRATPQRLHALVQVLFNILLRNTFSSLKKISGNCCHIKILGSKPGKNKSPLQNKEANSSNSCTRGWWFYSGPL